MRRIVQVGTLAIGNDLPFVLIAGPCQIESRAHALEVATALRDMSGATGVSIIYKSSFDKANRTSVAAARGIGIGDGLAHSRRGSRGDRTADAHRRALHPSNAASRRRRSTCCKFRRSCAVRPTCCSPPARPGKPINVKKGQFLAPWDMANVAAKIASTGNHDILLCERGASFGYNTLVSDFRALPIMARTGYPVVFDATHSVQQPGGQGGSSGGEREFAPVLARAALAVGVAAVFIETHPDPDRAPSDGPNMIPLREMPALIARLKAFDELAKRPT